MHDDGETFAGTWYSAAPLPQEGDNETCFFCGKPCSSLAGDPGQWPLGFAHPDGTGVVQWHHTSCVVDRLFPHTDE